MDEIDLADFDTFSAPEAQAEVPQQEVAPIEQPIVEEAEPILADFDAFTTPEQPQAPQMQVDPMAIQVEQHRPPEVDDMTWDDIKSRVGKFLTDYTPAMAIPQMATQLMGEAQQREGTQVTEAQSVKARLENIDFSYSDLADTFKSAIGDEESTQLLKTKQNKLNDDVVSILSDRGIEAYNDGGKLKVVTTDKDGNEIVKDLSEDTFDEILGGFKAGAGEIGGAIIGATGGAVEAQKFVPKTAPLQTRATAGLIGAGIGGYTGAAVGRATDLIRNAISLNKEIDAKEVLTKSLEAGTADIAGAAVIGLAAKGVSKAIAPLGKMTDRLRTLFKEGDIQGAKRVVKEDYGLTDDNIDTMFESVAKDVEGLEDLTGDDLLRAKLTAVIQQQPQGKALITSAIRKNAKAAIETSKEIDFRAKQVLSSADKFSKKPSAIKKSLAAYEKIVGKNYGEVRELIDTALPNYKSDLKLVDFTETLTDLNTRVIDPLVKEKLSNLSLSLSKQKSETIGDLIDTRQLFNKFYGKNKSHFESKVDKDALMSIQKTIDSKIDEAINTIEDVKIKEIVDGKEVVKTIDVSAQLKNSFEDAKGKYAQMFKTQDTATYNAIFKKGASEEEIGKSLLRYSKATDKDLENVLNKLSPVQRTKSEFSILKQMIDTATAKGEAKAIDFRALLEDIGTSKEIFKTPEAKQFLKNIENFDKKFAKDIDIQKIAAGVSPQVEKNIATGVMGKIWMKISSMRFEAMQRMLPTETGRRLSLQKSIESALEKSRTPKEFFFNASKIKGMPNKDRIALKKAVKDIGAQQDILKKEILDQEAKNKASIEKALQEKTKKETQERLKKQTLSKEQWQKAKDAATKHKLSERAEKAKQAMEVPQGGSEAEATQAVKNVFTKNKSLDAKLKKMSKADIAELERLDIDELLKSKPKGMSDEDWIEANLIFGREPKNALSKK